MHPISQPGKIVFEFDNWCGGFLLQLSRITEQDVRPLFGNLMRVFYQQDGRMAAIESAWQRGGLPLNDIHFSETCPKGSHTIDNDELRGGNFLLRQTPTQLSIWFSSSNEVPDANWIIRESVDPAVTAYFSTKEVKAGRKSKDGMLAGLQIDFNQTVIRYPVRYIRFIGSDFK